jgi:hypothetical protein
MGEGVQRSIIYYLNGPEKKMGESKQCREEDISMNIRLRF